MEKQNTENIAQGKPSFLEMAEDMLAAAEAGDAAGVERNRMKFTEAGGQFSGAYMVDPRYNQINVEEVKGGNN